MAFSIRLGPLGPFDNTVGSLYILCVYPFFGFSIKQADPIKKKKKKEKKKKNQSRHKMMSIADLKFLKYSNSSGFHLLQL